MRVLHLFASPYWSGPAENIALLALAQRGLGHEVTVAIDRKRTTAPAEEAALPRFARLELLGADGPELCVKSSPARLWSDLRAIRRYPADVIHCHFTHDHYLARLSRTDHQVLIRSIHAPRSIRWSLPSADGFTVASERDRERLGTARPVMVLPALVGPEYNAIQDQGELRRNFGISGAPVVGMASTFKKSRRHDLGLEAFRKLLQIRPTAQLVLIGDGEELPGIKMQVSRLGLMPSVHFTGYLSGADYVRRLRSLDVLWVLGLGNDWSARVAAQANACEVAVVGVDQGALAQLADVVVPPRSGDAIVQATLGAHRKGRSRPTNQEIACQVLDFYRHAGRAITFAGAANV